MREEEGDEDELNFGSRQRGPMSIRGNNGPRAA
jgi:hypothetical protein